MVTWARRGVVVDLAVASGLAGVAALHSYVGEDLRLWDETAYLARGIDPAQFGVPGWEDSVTYTLMYKAIGIVTADNIDAYFVGRALSAVAVVVGVFIAARLVSNRTAAALAASVMVSLPITYIWPGVAGPAAGAIIIALAMLLRWPRPGTLGLSLVLMWCAAGSRPEFTWVCLVLSLLAVVWSVWSQWAKREMNLWQWVAVAVGALGIPVLVLLRFGNVLEGSPRQWTAFTQHFALRQSTAGVDAWVSATDIASKIFPGASSFSQALSVNAGAVFDHMQANAFLLPVTFGGHLMGFGEASLGLDVIGKMVATLFLLGIGMSLFQNRRVLMPALRHLVHVSVRGKQAVATVCVVLVMVGMLIPQVVIYPRPHYLVLPIAIFVVVGAWGLSRAPNRGVQWIIPLGTSALGVLLVLATALANLPGRMAEAPPWENSVRGLRDLGAPVHMVTVDPNVCVYVANCVALDAPQDSAQTLEAYLRQNHVDAVLRVPIFMQSPWGALPGAQSFYQDPMAFGFRNSSSRSPFVIRSEDQ